MEKLKFERAIETIQNMERLSKDDREKFLKAKSDIILAYCQLRPKDSLAASYYRTKFTAINREDEVITRLLKKEPTTALKAGKEIVKQVLDYIEFVSKR